MNMGISLPPPPRARSPVGRSAAPITQKEEPQPIRRDVAMGVEAGLSDFGSGKGSLDRDVGGVGASFHANHPHPPSAGGVGGGVGDYDEDDEGDEDFRRLQGGQQKGAGQVRQLVLDSSLDLPFDRRKESQRESLQFQQQQQKLERSPVQQPQRYEQEERFSPVQQPQRFSPVGQDQ
ncbi:hypothetical protein HK097_006697, partial [Rhizophlyctis rosea]